MQTEFNKTISIIELLEQTTKLSVLSDFLKAKGLKHSAGSWKEMSEKRLLPAIENNQLTNFELIALLRSAEECGKQHVFLYLCERKDAASFIDKNRVQDILRSKGLASLIDEPNVLLQPSVPEIVDVRIDGEDPGQSLVIKQVELRTHQKLVGTEQRGNNFLKVYENIDQRAVSVAKLHLSGLLEIRITSHANSSKYDSDLTRFLLHINEFIPFISFSEISLTKAKDRLWSERETNRTLVRYTDATVCNVEGNLLRAFTGSDKSSLSSDTAIGNSLDLLIKEDKDAYCADANLWFNKSDVLSSDIHVLLNGDVNEFALPAHCSEADYEYVLNQIRFFNR
jgi:hypothetical protein